MTKGFKVGLQLMSAESIALEYIALVTKKLIVFAVFIK